MNFKPLYPDGYIPTRECVRGLYEQSIKTIRLMNEAHNAGNYTLSSTLADLYNILHNAFNQAFDRMKEGEIL